MIRSALDCDADAEELGTQMEAIAFHCNVQPADIRILDVDDGGDMRVLRHFVAIDRKTCSVVLALRGTLSISGALVDMKGMDRTLLVLCCVVLCRVSLGKHCHRLLELDYWLFSHSAVVSLL